MKFPWTKKKNDIEFVDTTRSIYTHYPIQLAKTLKPLPYAAQKAAGVYKFAQCPGMIDYAELGYIVPAWTDISILTNKAGTAISLSARNRYDRGFKTCSMDSAIGLGILEPDDIPLHVKKIDSPWKIFTDKDISALVLPAVYHSSFLHELYIWSGIVDYQKFHTLNFIISPKKEGKLLIKAGDPLLHIIPFNNKLITAEYGPANDYQIDIGNNEIPGNDKQYYRKYFMRQKIFNLFKRSNTNINI